MNLIKMPIHSQCQVTRLIQEIIRQKECETGLDVGCGRFSNLTAMRPSLYSTGIDVYAPAIEEAQHHHLHDDYIVDDIMRHDFADRRFDVVVASEVIEHLDKWAGWDLLRRMESLASKLVIVTTPNGFLPQGPEFGNPWQRHLSGWFVNDFESLGYIVRGTAGPKFMRGYAGELKWRGARVLNPVSQFLGRTLAPWPHMHFGLLAIKDLDGVLPRLSRKN